MLTIVSALMLSQPAHAAPCPAGDSDADSLLDVDEDVNGNGDCDDDDVDGDGVANYLDVDDDGDGADTYCERFFGVDHLQIDTDGDQISDGDEWLNWLDPTLPPADYLDADGGSTGFGCLDPWDRDSDRAINALDTDDDCDGILSISEGAGDLDCAWPTALPSPDGIPNYLDWDSDNDLIPDGLDGDGYAADGLGDLDADFIPDFLDCDNNSCTGDSDQDGFLNCDEDAACPDPLGFCRTDPDSDDDGVPDGREAGNLASPGDTDLDGTFDLYDDDDDGDGIATRPELGLDCPSGETWDLRYDELLGWVPHCPTDNVDLLAPYRDTDADGLPDYRDADDDGDGISTIDEGTGDEDQDGVPDWLDPATPDAEGHEVAGERNPELVPGPQGPSTDDRSGQTARGEGCGCSSAPSGGALPSGLTAWLLLGLGWRRRR